MGQIPAQQPILAAATMLIPPYLFTYDALLIVVPMGWLVKQQCHPFVLAFVWLCCFIPIITYFSPWLGPNFISVGAIACLWALHTRPSQRQSSKSMGGSSVAPSADVAAAQ